MKIAIVRLSAMGDIIHSMVVLQFIKHHFPDAAVDWICEEAFKPLLESNPDIHNIYTVTIKEAKKKKSFSLLWKNIRFLRTLGPYDLIIDMQGLIKSALVARLIGKNVHGFSKNSIREKLASFFYKSTTQIAYDQNTIVRNLTLVSDALNFPFSVDQLKSPKPFIISRNSLPSFIQIPYTVLVVGSTWESRNYPDQKWIELVEKAKDRRFLVVWGSPKEYRSGKHIAAAAANVTIAPKTSMDELIAIISNAELLIGNDTGPTHLAWAAGVPSVTLFGPTPVSRIFETPINMALKSPSVVDPYRLDKNDFSIKEITADAIIDKIQEVLHGAV